MKRFLALIIAIVTLLSIIPMSISAEGEAAQAEKQTLVFVDRNDGIDTNDGKSEDSPVQTLQGAYALLDLTKDCTVVLMSNGIALAGDTGKFEGGCDTKGNNTGSVTITSVYGEKDYRKNNIVDGKDLGGFRTSNATFSVWVDTIFENVDINQYSAKFFVFVQGHSFTVKETVTINDMSGGMTGTNDAKSFTIVGGFQSNLGAHDVTEHARDTHIEVFAGSKILIGAFNRLYTGKNANDHSTGVVHTGDCYITVGGNAQVGNIYYSNLGENTGESVGNTIVTVKDNAKVSSILHNGHSEEIGGLIVNYLGGSIGGVDSKGIAIKGNSVLNYVEATASAATSLLETTAAEKNPFKTNRKLANVEIYGYQTVKNKSDIRLLAVITESDISAYNYVGFKVKIEINGSTYFENNQKINTIYRAVNAVEGNGYEKYTAMELGGYFIFGLDCNISVENENTTAKFTVTPYYDAGGTEYEGATRTFDVIIAKGW